MKRDRFFKDEAFEFMTELALGATYYHGADIGECLSTVARIKNGDGESWYAERKALVSFRAAEGADSHCEPRALGLRDQRVFDWLDEALSLGRG